MYVYAHTKGLLFYNKQKEGGGCLVPSEAKLQKKKEVVQELTEKIASAKSIVFADYRGLTVEQDTQMRKALREAGIEYKVVKNTLVKFALKENGHDGIDEYFNSPTAMALSDSDPVAPAKIISEYAKKFESLEIKTGIVEGKVVDINAIKELADLPSREVLIAKVLGGFNAPISGLVNVLNGNIRGLVVGLNAIAEKKAAANA